MGILFSKNGYRHIVFFYLSCIFPSPSAFHNFLLIFPFFVTSNDGPYCIASLLFVMHPCNKFFDMKCIHFNAPEQTNTRLETNKLHISPDNSLSLFFLTWFYFGEIKQEKREKRTVYLQRYLVFRFVLECARVHKEWKKNREKVLNEMILVFLYHFTFMRILFFACSTNTTNMKHV